MNKIDNDTLNNVLDALETLKTSFGVAKGREADRLFNGVSIAADIIGNYHLAYWQYGKVEDYYSCERCGHVIDWYGMPLADLPDRCSCCGNYMHKDARPSPEAYPELYKPQGFTFNVDKIKKFEDASCENCEHAFRGADPLKILQDSGNIFSCSAGFKYGGSETVCSEWRRKEGDQNE